MVGNSGSMPIGSMGYPVSVAPYQMVEDNNTWLAGAVIDRYHGGKQWIWAKWCKWVTVAPYQMVEDNNIGWQER